MKTWKQVVTLSLLTLMAASVSATADDTSQTPTGADCLKGFEKSRDEIALKYHVTKDGLLTDAMIKEIKIPAGCTDAMVTVEMQKEAKEAYEEAFGKPDQVSPGDQAFSSDDSTKPGPIVPLTPQGRENIYKFLSGLAF